MLINWSMRIIVINFIKVTGMFGLCQNVQIIHQHHHHFYQVVIPSSPKTPSSLSKTFSQPSSYAQIGLQTPREKNAFHETHTSRVYHSKRSYFGRNQKGIEVVTAKGHSSISYQKTTTKQHQNQNNHSKPIEIQPFITPNSFQSKVSISKIYQYPQYQQKSSKQFQNELLQFNSSIQKSVPSVDINYTSQKSSIETKQNYLNCHQLKESKVGLNNACIYDTKKKTWLYNNTETNITVSVPTSYYTPRLIKPNSQIMKKTQNDKDSILTKKQNSFLPAFKTQTMFDDAKSFISRQSFDNKSQINVEESIIISRSMDYFCHVTAQRELDSCKIYLAVDLKINWIVAIRLFDFKHENLSMRQSQMYSLLGVNEINRDNLPFLSLYKIMIQGVGLHKNIYFVLEPYQCLLDEYLNNRKGYFKAVPSSLNYFVLDLEQQLLAGLSQLERAGIILNEPIQINDIVIVNGKYRFHSISKFTFACENNMIFRQVNRRTIQKFKGEILSMLNNF